MTALLGVLDGDAASRARVLREGPALLETPRLVVAGQGTAGRAADGTACVLIGTVSNLDELAGQLDPRERSAADVVAELFARHGAAASQALRGRYLLVILTRPGEVLLTADAFGARSLHLASDGESLVFGEDVRDVLAALSARPSPDRGTVSLWLSDGTVPAARSFYEGITRVPAGTGWRGTSARGGGLWPWFRIERPSRRDMLRELPEAAEIVRGELIAAAARALASTTARTGVMLSGGLDSSSVAAAAVAGLDGQPLQAIGAAFPHHPNADEGELIRETADRLGLRLHLEALTEMSPIARWSSYASEWSLPFPYPAGHMTQAIFEAARAANVDVLLTGQGGDETSYNVPFPYLMDLVRTGRARRAWELASHAPLVPASRRTGLKVLRATAQFVWGSGSHDEAPAAALLRAPDGRGAEEQRRARRWQSESGPLWWRHRYHQLTATREMVDASGGLRRLGESVGISQIHPFLHDRDLIERMLTLHPSIMFDSRNDRIATRDAMRSLLPASVLDRREKSHFTDLHTNWLAGDGRAAVDQVLRSRSDWTEFLDPAAVEDRLLRTSAPEDHPGGTYGWSSEIHRVVALQLWLTAERDA